jgi:hypothetical protein
MVIDLQLNPSDWAAFHQVALQRARARVGTARLLAAGLLPLAVAALLVSGQAGRHSSTAFFGFAAGMGAAMCASAWSNHLLRQQLMPDPDGEVLGGVHMELAPEGIRTARSASVGLTQWSALSGITRTDTHVFLWTDRAAAHIVPLRHLPEGPDALLETIRVFGGPVPIWSDSSATTDSNEASTTGPAPGFVSTLISRLTWQRVAPEATRVASSDAMIATCACVALGIWLGYDRHVAGPGASWYMRGGTVSLAWYALGVLALAWVVHRASLGEVPLRSLLAPIVASLPLLLVLGLALRLWAPERIRATRYVLFACVVLVCLKRCLALAGVPARGALRAGLLFLLLFAAATNAIWIYPHFWFPERHEDERHHESADFEHVLFGLPDRIDAAAARMSPGRKPGPNLFFVGFAGVGGQKVFAEELKLAEHVVTERYDAIGRSLLLINDDRDHDRWPIATVDGLRRALVRVGQRMNREQDVLFLMLTSHGSAEPALSVSNGYWPLSDLDGHAVRAALDESGIRWRVIVISACHAGAFIEPLADHGTIVLTAAAKERTSFGCSDSADLTYFGQALIRDALPGATSLEDAFEQAKRLIADREQREKLKASEPQAYYGSAIRPYWQRLEEMRPKGKTAPDSGLKAP